MRSPAASTPAAGSGLPKRKAARLGLGWVFMLSLLATGLSGCGSSHRRSYSVRQVESAFATHGITLHQRDRTTGAVVALVARGGIRVLVNLQARDWSVGWTGEKPLQRGNLIIFRSAAYEHAVNSALGDLR